MCTRLWVTLLITLSMQAIGHAQDMSFSLADVGEAERGRAAAAPGAQAPSATFVAGLRAYGHERYAEAAVQLQRVVQGDTSDGLAAVQRAQLHLGKALVHLGYIRSALSVFDEITTASPRHPDFEAVLPWLAELATRSPDASSVAVLVGRFAPQDLERLEGATRARLLLMMARNAYDERELERAVVLLERIPVGAPTYVDAQLLLGITHVRARRAHPAIAAFREVLRALDEGDAGDPGDPDGLRDLAWLSLGRIYYTAAHGRGAARARGQLMGSAVDAWSRVSSQSDLWLDALFESAWALFVSDQHARALGNIHALLSPYFAGAFYPEAHVIKAVAFYDSCQMHNASAVVQGFHRRYGPLQEGLSTLLARRRDGSGYALLDEVRRGALRAPPSVRAVLEQAFSRRDVARSVAQVDALAAQQKRLAASGAALRTSALGERIRQDLAVAVAFARAQAGELALGRAERVLAELQEIANQMDTVEIEILKWRRAALDAPPVVPRGVGGRGGDVVVDSEHVIWPFDGEYWRDELGYYRQQVSDRCPER